MNNYASKRVNKALKGEIIVPGDKSCSHRALIFASQILGEVKISGLLEAEDVMATKEALQGMGVSIVKDQDNYIVKGVGLKSLVSPENILDLKNSGTGVRLLMGMVATQNVRAVFTGDESLVKRPMNRVVEPLKKFNAEFDVNDGGKLPITVKGNGFAIQIEHEIEVASAQVKSALILASINASGRSKIIEPILTRDHTEVLMKYLGFDIEEEKLAEGKIIYVNGGKDVKAKDIVVSGDPSSAAFIAAAALLVRGSEILIKNILANPSRIGFFEILKKMGADIKYLNEREVCGEKVFDIKVKYSELKGIEVPADIAPSAIDEYPILAVVASKAQGKTKMLGLEELKVKESNRFNAIIDNLKLCGVEVEAGDDWLEVSYSDKIIASKKIKSYMDHRIAMSFIILGLVSESEIEIDDISMIKTSFPNFLEILDSLKNA